MRPTTILLTAAALALAGVASAQGVTPAASGAGDMNAAPLGSPAHPIPQNSPTPADQAYRLKAGDPSVISNAPIPDTPQNRSSFGAPLSYGGKATTASGN